MSAQRETARRTWCYMISMDSSSGRCAAELLAGYHSTQAKLVGCMAHARRKFEEAQRAQPNAKVGKAV